MKSSKQSIEIELIDVGRRKFTGKKTVKKPSLQTIRKAIQPHLASKGWDLAETDQPHLYDLFAGDRWVGQVRIEQDECLAYL